MVELCWPVYSKLLNYYYKLHNYVYLC